MCGIFGFLMSETVSIQCKDLRHLIDRLFILSESRGKESAGLAFMSKGLVHVLKKPCPASRFIRSKDYKRFLDFCASETPPNSATALIGHSRLVTDGSSQQDYNNQPVEKDGLTGIHNGIIVNVSEIYERHPLLTREYEVDTEVLLAIMSEYLRRGFSTPEVLRLAMEEIVGSASVAVFVPEREELAIATNTGSLYFHKSEEGLPMIFASERYILESALSDRKVVKALQTNEVVQLSPGRGIVCRLGDLSNGSITFNTRASTERDIGRAGFVLSNLGNMRSDTLVPEASAELRRCTKCILPETMPFIKFDENGVCNYCKTYVPMHVQGLDSLSNLVDSYKCQDGSPDCLVMFSGGRDSSYGLHVIKAELGLHPIAFSYDWGMLTDLARRNQARMCGLLGVEHIIVSADIKKKREFIRKNIKAWLAKPHLGMVPLFMAGDKQYYYYANQLRKRLGITLLFVCECPLELSRFKAGFCGVNEGPRRIFNISFYEKLNLLFYYASQFIANPAYFNSSLIDTIFAFWSSYFINHDYIFLYNFERWEEDRISQMLINEYDWEVDKEASSTWRIGDGTTAFYNYIYNTVAGFSENDTLRSNQIREGMITRQHALELVAKDNQPRWGSMRWYANVVGFELEKAVDIINSMPKLYDKHHGVS